MLQAGDRRSLSFGPPEEATPLFPEGRQPLQLGDCLVTSQRIPAQSLGLIYLDPPFGTGRPQPYRSGLGRIETPLLDRGDPQEWCARWLPRIDAMIRALRPGGILVVHLDPRLAPRVRVSLDARLGADNFLNEIVWHYRTGGIARDRFASKHDTLLVYRNGRGHTFQRLTEKRYLAHRMMRAGVEEFQDQGGWYRRASIDDVWEVGHVTPDSRERVGYPTQKPEALIERLLLAFTMEGDAVADLACGGGTLPAVAQRLARRWIAADLDPRAIVCTGARIARLIAPALTEAWTKAGVAGRRGDLGERLARWRVEPNLWGFTQVERSALQGVEVCRPGFRIEWDADGTVGA